MPEYKPHLNINQIYSKLSPNNCAVRLFDGEGKPVGPCAHYLKDGRCPTHGEVFADYPYAKIEGLKNKKSWAEEFFGRFRREKS